MTVENRFVFYKKVASMWKLIAFMSIFVVVVLELTRWRPFGYSDNSDGINNLLVTLAYSIIGANLFYCFNHYLPSLSRNYVSKEYVGRRLWKVKEQLRLLIEMDLHPFCLERKRITKESYIADFECTDLNEPSPFGKNNSKADTINKRADTIVDICNELLSSYLNVLTEKQLEFINSVFRSQLVCVRLRPTVWDEDNKPIVSHDDNQKEIGLCVYELYEQSSKLQA